MLIARRPGSKEVPYRTIGCARQNAGGEELSSAILRPGRTGTAVAGRLADLYAEGVLARTAAHVPRRTHTIRVVSVGGHVTPY